MIIVGTLGLFALFAFTGKKLGEAYRDLTQADTHLDQALTVCREKVTK